MALQAEVGQLQQALEQRDQDVAMLEADVTQARWQHSRRRFVVPAHLSPPVLPWALPQA